MEISTKSAGRPTKYDSAIPSKLIEYFSLSPYIKDGRKNIPSDFPSLAGFAIKIGVCRDTLNEWSRVHPEFSDAYKRAKDFQENYLLVNGNKGLINTTFAIFTAKNVLNWREKSNLNIKSEVEQLSDEDLEIVIKNLIASNGHL